MAVEAVGLSREANKGRRTRDQEEETRFTSCWNAWMIFNMTSKAPKWFTRYAFCSERLEVLMCRSHGNKQNTVPLYWSTAAKYRGPRLVGTCNHVIICLSLFGYRPFNIGSWGAAVFLPYFPRKFSVFLRLLMSNVLKCWHILWEVFYETHETHYIIVPRLTAQQTERNGERKAEIDTILYCPRREIRLGHQCT